MKRHTKILWTTQTDIKNKIITEIGLTTAKTYDGNVDLAKADEINYCDRVYSGNGTKAKGDVTIKRGKLILHERLKNKSFIYK